MTQGWHSILNFLPLRPPVPTSVQQTAGLSKRHAGCLLGPRGLDLLVTVPVPMCKAALGGEIEAPCLKESADDTCRIPVKIPEGAQTGRTVRLKGKGMPSLRGPQRGDLIVELFVETPTKLNARQKELMKELAGLCGDQHHPQAASFVGKTKKFWEKCKD